MVQYRKLNINELGLPLFRSFQRRQVVTDCWRKENGQWVVKSDPFIDDWGEKDYEILIFCLKNTIATDDLVYGAFADGELKGFAREKNAKKLYISAHSAVESPAFYKAMGCVEAKEYNAEHVEKEPYDCQLECDM